MAENIMNKKTSSSTTVENGVEKLTPKWIVGDESYDSFPGENGDQVDNVQSSTRSIPGFGGLSPAEQIALLEKRKRLKLTCDAFKINSDFRKNAYFFFVTNTRVLRT